ncbi:MAG: hypothetical protein KAX05_10490, partial [Bacteroidales bacterium]|nr:hypothetical protein [Bacteroidales bacterium]
RKGIIPVIIKHGRSQNQHITEVQELTRTEVPQVLQDLSIPGQAVPGVVRVIRLRPEAVGPVIPDHPAGAPVRATGRAVAADPQAQAQDLHLHRPAEALPRRVDGEDKIKQTIAIGLLPGFLPSVLPGIILWIRGFTFKF